MAHKEKWKEYGTIAVEKSFHEEAKKFCVLNGYTLGGLVTQLLEDFMNKKKGDSNNDV